MTRSLEFLTPEDPERKEVMLDLLPLATWGGRPHHAETLARAELGSADAGYRSLVYMHLAESIGMQDRWWEAVDAWDAFLHDDKVAAPLRLRARAELATALAFCRELQRARSLADDLLAEGEIAPDETTRYLALQAAWACLFFEGRSNEAVTVAGEMVAMTDASGDVRLSWRNPRLLLGVSQTVAGQVDQAASVLVAARELARGRGALWALPLCQSLLALLHYRRGLWDQAAAECEEGLRICERSGSTLELGALLGNYAVIEVRRGAFQRAERLVERFDELEQPTHGDRAWRRLASALIDEGRGESRLAYDELAEVWRETSDLGVSLVAMLIAPDLVRLARDAGDRQLGQEVVNYFEAMTRTNAGSAWASALLAHCRGLVLASPDDLEEAIASYGNAAHEPHRALAWEELAIIWAGEGRSRKALSALREALHLFDAMGAVGDARRARARLRKMDVFAPPPAAAAPEGGKWGLLTTTEKTVAELVGEGLKNREIAERLFVSVQTVQTHLKNIFRKLGASSRSQVVREVMSREARQEDASRPSR